MCEADLVGDGRFVSLPRGDGFAAVLGTLENSSTFIGVQGSSPWRSAISKRPHGAIAARLVLNQETPEHYRVRVPLSFAR